MTDTNTRTNWADRLRAACAAWEATVQNRRMTAHEMIYPAEPGIVVRIDSTTPHTFPTMRAAALKVEAWVEGARL
jgi:hypothetical protein